MNEWYVSMEVKRGLRNSILYRGISLLSVPGKTPGRVLNERMMKVTDNSVGDEQGGFQRERMCRSNFCTENNGGKVLKRRVGSCFLI